MIPTSAKELVRYTPPDAEGGDTPPVYLLAVPTLLQRAAYRRDLVAAGAQYASDTALYETLRDGIRELSEGAGQAELLELVDLFEADQAKPLEERDKSLAQDLAEIERSIGAHFPPYAQALAARTHWMNVAPIIACRHFLRGWEGVDVPFKARAGLVSDELLELLPEAHVFAVGFKAISLLSPSRAEQKN